MPTTTAVFGFIPGEETEHSPELDNLISAVPDIPLSGLPIFETNGITTTNKISDTIDVETSTRTIVREWASESLAAEFVTTMQATYTLTDDSIPSWPGRLISIQVNS